MSFESFPKSEEQQPAESSKEIDSTDIERELKRGVLEREKIQHGRYKQEEVWDERRKKALEEERVRGIRAVEEEMSKWTPEERRKMLAD